MNTLCGHKTKSGHLCKNSKNCHLHRDSAQETMCSICLNPVRKTRGSRELSCGHLYHTKCISQWRDDAHRNTCPVCRKNFDMSRYRVTFTIHNTETGNTQDGEIQTANIYQIFENFDFSEIGDFATTEINFEIDDFEDLETLINDLGMTVEV